MKSSPFTDFDALPLLLSIREVAAIYRISESTIRRGLQDNSFKPKPFERYPYRWRKDAIVADLKRDRDASPHKPHGFASVRRRPAKASLENELARRAR